MSSRAISLVLWPMAALAQESANGDVRLPYLWIWLVVGLALLGFLLYLLFSTSPRERARAHASERARRRVQDRS